MLIKRKCRGIVLIAGKCHSVGTAERFLTNIVEHKLQCGFSVSLSLFTDVNHHMPDIVFGDVIIINNHHVSHNFFIRIYPEGTALLTVNICLGKTADGMRNIGLLPLAQLQVEHIQKIAFIYRL